MTNYSKTTNFTAKDSLVSGDANKIVKGSEIDAEFDNIATASATKANIASPAFTGVVSFPDGTAGDPSITNTGDTNTGLFFSAADTLAFSSAGTAQFTMADGAIAPVTDNDVDLGTSSLEFKDGYFDGTVHTDAINLNGTAITSTAAEINILDGVTATTAELNYNDTGSAVGTVVASKVVTVDANKDVASFRNITLTGELDAGSLDISGDADIDGTLETDALSINGTAVTSTAAELNILDGVTSTAAELNILDGVTSTAAELNILDGVTSTAAELNILDGVTASAADINLIDGITNGTVIASKAIITDSNKDITGGRNITISGELDAATLDISGDADIDGTLETDALSINGTAVTSTAAELNILDGVTSTAAELNTLDGITAVVGELNALDLGSTAVGIAIASKAVVLDSNKDFTGVRNFSITGDLSVAGTTTVVDSVQMTANNAVIFEGATADASETTLTSVDATADRTISLPDQSGTLPVLAAVSTTAITSTPEELNVLDGITAVVGELNALDLGSTAVGTAIASKAVILDSNKDYTGIRNFTISGELDAASLDISGDIDVDGTTNLDVVDIDGAVDMASTLAVAGVVTLGGNLNIPQFIVHDGDTDTYIKFDDNTIRLFAGNSQAIDVTSSGVIINQASADLDFRVESDGNANMLFVDGGNDRVLVGKSSSGLANQGVEFEDGQIKGTATGQTVQFLNRASSAGTILDLRLDNTTKGEIAVESTGLVINEASADLDFRVESNGNTHMLFVNAGNDRVGIGVDPGTAQFEVLSASNQVVAHFAHPSSSTSDNNGGAILNVQNTNSTNGNMSSVIFRDSNNNASSGIFGYNSDHSDGEGLMTFGTRNSSGTFGERSRIDSSGTLLIGKQAANNGTAGVEASTAALNATVSGDTVSRLNRLSSDGEILRFQKDTTTVATIGSRGGVVSHFVLDPRSNGAGITGAGAAIFPTDNSGTISDGAIDLGYFDGSNSFRWKDLRLSGGVYVGGTGSANHLDDYEEGDWVPILKDGGSTTLTITINQATYTKTGRFVMVSAYIHRNDGASLTGNLTITNLPFTIKSGDTNFNGGIWFDGTGTDLVVSCYLPGGNAIVYPKKVGDNSDYATTDQFQNGRPLYMSAMYHV